MKYLPAQLDLTRRQRLLVPLFFVDFDFSSSNTLMPAQALTTMVHPKQPRTTFVKAPEHPNRSNIHFFFALLCLMDCLPQCLGTVTGASVFVSVTVSYDNSGGEPGYRLPTALSLENDFARCPVALKYTDNCEQWMVVERSTMLLNNFIFLSIERLENGTIFALEMPSQPSTVCPFSFLPSAYQLSLQEEVPLKCSGRHSKCNCQ